MTTVLARVLMPKTEVQALIVTLYRPSVPFVCNECTDYASTWRSIRP